MKIQLRNDTTSNWESYNPILAPGEVGVDTSEGKIKVGDGSTSWSNLPYIGSVDLSNYVDLTSNQLVGGLKRFNNGLSTPNIYSPGTSRNILAREMVGADTFRLYLGDTAKTTEVVINTPELNQYFNRANHKVLTDNDIATTSTKGIVQPDGTTITINNGVISSVGGGGGSTYTEGNGIDITNNEISIDTSVVPTLSGNNAFSGSNSFASLITATSGIRTGNSTTISTTQTTQTPIVATMAIRTNEGGAWGNTTTYSPIIQYSHPLEDTQGIISIGSTSSSTVNDNKYYASGKLRLIAPEVLTRYDGTNEYGIIDSNNISSYLPTATASSKGLIQPDGTTIDIDGNGVISVSNILEDIPLGASRYSGDPLEANAGWLVSNGQWNTKALYPSFYSKALAKIGDSFASGSIVDSTNSYTDYDLVINQTDETFRLPLLDGSESLVGDTYENITVQASGTTYTAPKNGLLVVHGSTTAKNGNIHLYNTTANWAGTCQRPTLSGEAMLLYLPVRKGDVVQIDYNNATISYCIWQFAVGNGDLYFKVANSVENLDLVDVGELTNDLANKVDIDGLNFTNTGKVELSSYGMPSNTLINLSLGVSGSSYTAPSNGYLLMSFSGTANSAYAEILCYTGSNPQQNVVSNASTTLSGGWGRLMCPCKAGDVFNVYYGGGNFTLHNFEFVYAVGSESEAN